MSDIPSIIAAAVGEGSQGEFARLVGCGQQTISDFIRGTRRPSASMALKIEKATKGKITRHDLRADIFGPAPRKGAA